MPYKDKETQKKAQREWVRQKRDKGGKELTLEVAKEMERGSTKGSTYNFKVPERAKVLPADVVNRILAVLKSRATANLFDDFSARWDRAITYHNWKLAYQPVLIKRLVTPSMMS